MVSTSWVNSDCESPSGPYLKLTRPFQSEEEKAKKQKYFPKHLSVCSLSRGKHLADPDAQQKIMGCRGQLLHRQNTKDGCVQENNPSGCEARGCRREDLEGRVPRVW